MSPMPEFQTRQRLPMAVAILCAGLAASWHGTALGDPREDFLKERAVRVIVRGVTPNTSSSGFLWKQQNWVVTNLHAIPSDKGIKVKCGGLIQNAKVVKVLPRADLALLVVDPPAGDKPPLHKCKPFTEANLVEPLMGAELAAYGWMGDARKSSPRFMKKTTTGTLTDHFPSNLTVLEELKKYGIPDIKDVDFYILQGGSLPGYSGGSIVDDELRLVAIVDGGLNEGLNTVKWAIPASNLKDLESGVPWEPRYGIKPEWLWSTGIADPDEFSVLKYREVDTTNPDTGESTHFDYEWYRTKSLSLRQLAQTSVDPAGILSLLERYGTAAGGDVDPTFDVYEDLDQGLIIAIPVGQGLSFEPVADNPGYAWLESRSKLDWGGHIQFTKTRFGVTSSSDLESISPGDPRYFTEKVSELLAACNKPGTSECIVDEESLRIVRFANGNEILKVGFFVAWPGGTESYDYYSFAVRDDVAFRAFASFSYDDVGLMPCAFALDPEDDSCASPELASTQLSQMMAVHLTTFANLSQPGTDRSLETGFEYDSSGNDPSTFGVGFFEGDELRFYNSRGKMWREMTPGRNNGYQEYERSEDTVWVQFGYDHARIPIGGGEYYRSDDDGQTWSLAGVLERK